MRRCRSSVLSASACESSSCEECMLSGAWARSACALGWDATGAALSMAPASSSMPASRGLVSVMCTLMPLAARLPRGGSSMVGSRPVIAWNALKTSCTERGPNTTSRPFEPKVTTPSTPVVLMSASRSMSVGFATRSLSRVMQRSFCTTLPLPPMFLSTARAAACASICQILQTLRLVSRTKYTDARAGGRFHWVSVARALRCCP